MDVLRFLINSLVWGIGLVLKKVKTRNRNKSIILIRPDLIGDFILFTPSLAYLHNHYSEYKIILLMQDIVSPLIESCPYVDKVVVFNKKKYQRNIFYKFKLLRELFILKSEKCINTMYSRNRISEEFLLWVGAKENIGLDTKYPGMKINEKQRSDKNYQILVKLEDGHPIHELEINKKFLQGLGIVVISYVPKLWFIYNEIGPLNTVLKGRHKKNFIIIGIVPGAYDSYRTWGGAKFQTLMRELCYMHKEIIFFIFGNKSDQKYLDYLSLKNDEIIDLRGKTSLRELATLLYHCDIVIGNETGPLHIANAIGTKSFCILGGGHFGRFYPYPHSFDLKEIPSCFFQFRDCFSCGWHCIYSLTDNNSYRCIHEVSVEYVIKDVAAYIEDLFLENKNSKEKHSDAS